MLNRSRRCFPFPAIQNARLSSYMIIITIIISPFFLAMDARLRNVRMLK
jgi:hypothetical protein